MTMRDRLDELQNPQKYREQRMELAKARAIELGM